MAGRYVRRIRLLAGAVARPGGPSGRLGIDRPFDPKERMGSRRLAVRQGGARRGGDLKTAGPVARSDLTGRVSVLQGPSGGREDRGDYSCRIPTWTAPT